MALCVERRQWPKALEEMLTNLNFGKQQLQCAKSRKQEERLGVESERFGVSYVKSRY